jgi:ribonuclease HI
MSEIAVYTDGSCNPAYRIGAWASIILNGKEKVILKGHALDTTHQRMELTAVVRSLEYLPENNPSSFPVTLYTDSQYVTGLLSRKEKLTTSGFITKKNNALPNADLIRQFFTLCLILPISIVKVKSHQKETTNEQLNGEVDKLCRKVVRELVESQ